MNWYTRITQDLSVLPDFIQHYDAELDAAKSEVGIKGIIEKQLASLPGITEHRYHQLQTVEAVLNYLNIELKRTKSKHFKRYLENYQRALSSRDVEKYVDGEAEVVNMEMLINEVALLRNRYLAIMKGLEAKQWQLGHIVKLRTVGMEDAMI
jgi:uncharacterized protein YfdQ (DUF2303 family)